MNEFQKTVEKIKLQIAAAKAKHEVKKDLKKAQETIDNLQSSAKAYINQQKAKAEIISQEDWASILKNDLKDGWDEIADTAKDAWNSVTGKSEKA